MTQAHVYAGITVRVARGLVRAKVRIGISPRLRWTTCRQAHRGTACRLAPRPGELSKEGLTGVANRRRFDVIIGNRMGQRLPLQAAAPLFPNVQTRPVCSSSWRTGACARPSGAGETSSSMI